MKRTPRRTMTIAALVAVPALALAPVAAAVPVGINFACQASALGSTYDFTLTQPADVSAPASVSAGSAFSVTIDPAAASVPATVGTYALRRVQNLTFKVPVPANSTYVSGSLSGGSGVGATALSQAGGVVTLTATGPVNGGASFELPAITLNLTAGSPGTVETTLYGSGYGNPGLTATAVVRVILLDVNVPASCYPDPNPVLTTTTVV
ncbi:cyclase [Actinokineospora auranticolor]|uniref:Dehydratase n=1 Tax=Actinokineospora auranticolor TaxID=155976 RepID=A0A2S6GV33_9PSEU|nr:cyclase [Actinokineospora auranticolor]PPK69105.1 dehydratase [Actinokineospora auranticolor]